LAKQLRADLNTAGVTRAELFERSAVRRPVRVHDLRATFVTISLANGKSETWVADRTGHRSSAMINRYRRQARTWAELGLDELSALDRALPELAALATRLTGQTHESADRNGIR
jgi:integrase